MQPIDKAVPEKAGGGPGKEYGSRRKWNARQLVGGILGPPGHCNFGIGADLTAAQPDAMAVYQCDHWRGDRSDGRFRGAVVSCCEAI